VALDEGVKLLLCVNPLVPFDASSAAQRGRLTVGKLNKGGLPLVLAQAFRAIIHSRMHVGMEKYSRQYPDASILLFEPDRGDVDMFFANILSYWQRKRMCAIAFAKTRQNLVARAHAMAPVLQRHGIAIRHDRLSDPAREVRMALNDSRPLRPDSSQQSVREATRELRHTLDQLERAVAAAR
jgi:hypothetical protein